MVLPFEVVQKRAADVVQACHSAPQAGIAKGISQGRVTVHNARETQNRRTRLPPHAGSTFTDRGLVLEDVTIVGRHVEIEAMSRPNFVFDFMGCIGIVAEELLGILATLADPLIAK